MKEHNFRKQVPKNLAINIFSFVSTVLIGLWLTPYLLKNLGIVAYGLIPLAMFFSQYIGIILNSINMSIGRFLLIHLQKEEERESNEIFNTSLVIISVFVVLQTLVMAIVVFDITFFFDIPDDLVKDAMWLFGLTFIGFSISLFRSVFGTSLFAYNRLDILRMIDIIQNVVRVLTIIILFVYDEPSLKYIGIANLLASISAVVPTLYYFKVYTPQLKMNLSFFSKERVSELSKMSTWILINQVGVLLLGNIDLYMVNILIGGKATGEYAIIIQITSIFKTLILLLSSVLSPVIMIYYANKEFDKLKTFIIISSKVMVVGFILPLAVLVGLSEYILELWLGAQYMYLHKLISYSLLFFVFAIPVIPLFNITVAYNKVKTPALLAIGLGVINVISIYILTTQTKLGLWGVISVKLILEILFLFFIIIYVSKLLSIVYTKLLKVYFLSIIFFLILYFIVYSISTLIALNMIVNLILFISILSIIVYPTMIFVILTEEEKLLLFSRYTFLKKWGTR